MAGRQDARLNMARQVNLRLRRSGPDCAWRIFYYADSIFLGMRNTATPQVPLGVSPAEDEWWKVYMNIEYPTGATGEGNWPMASAGTPQGANVMNPLNAFIFGRRTGENKLLEKMGPFSVWKVLLWTSNIRVPRISDGNRSGVH